MGVRNMKGKKMWDRKLWLVNWRYNCSWAKLGKVSAPSNFLNYNNFLSKFYKDLIVSKFLEIFLKISSEVH